MSVASTEKASRWEDRLRLCVPKMEVLEQLCVHCQIRRANAATVFDM